MSQDVDTTDNTVAAYMAAAHNGQRLLAVPVVDPTDPNTTSVIGYGVFLLLANGPGTSNYYKSSTNGNDPYCAIYAGTYNVGSPESGRRRHIGRIPREISSMKPWLRTSGEARARSRR